MAGGCDPGATTGVPEGFRAAEPTKNRGRTRPPHDPAVDPTEHRLLGQMTGCLRLRHSPRGTLHGKLPGTDQKFVRSAKCVLFRTPHTPENVVIERQNVAAERGCRDAFGAILDSELGIKSRSTGSLPGGEKGIEPRT